MATLTVRNLPPQVVDALKKRARESGRSMEQEVRLVLLEYVGERASLLEEIEADWGRQKRRPTAAEVDDWIETGRV